VKLIGDGILTDTCHDKYLDFGQRKDLKS